eukprot:1091258-Rhodomonas_salina.1
MLPLLTLDLYRPSRLTLTTPGNLTQADHFTGGDSSTRSEAGLSGCAAVAGPLPVCQWTVTVTRSDADGLHWQA